MRLALALFAAVLAAPAMAQQVATLVAIPVPAGTPRAELVRLFDASQPQYRAIPGLVRKYYTIGSDGRAGGVYLWRDRAAADAFFTDSWKADVARRWGQPADLSWFEVPIALDGANAVAR